MPQNSFAIPGQQASPFTGFNDALWRDTQARTEREGRRATLGEYQAAGGQASDYHKIYGTPNQSFESLQQQYEGNGGRISQDAFTAAGFDPSTYGKIYGDSSAVNTQSNFAPVFDAQRQANYQQAGIDSQLNRINEFNPYGSSQYVTNPDGSVSRFANLSQPNQQQLDQQFSQDAARGELVSGLINNQGQSLLGGGSAADRAMSAENEVYNRYVTDLDRRFGQESDAIRTQLVNAGVPQGSERWNKTMLDLEKRKQDAYAGARTYAMEQGRAQGQFYNDNRNQIINEIGGLQGQQRGVQNPTFSQNYNVSMPYVDQATPTLNAFLQNQSQQGDFAFQNQARQADFDFQRQMAEYDAQQKKELQRIANAGRGGGGGSSGSSFDSKLEDYILQSAFAPRAPSNNPLVSGISAGLGTGLGAAIGSAFR
jgi:hypothetical protein